MEEKLNMYDVAMECDYTDVNTENLVIMPDFVRATLQAKSASEACTLAENYFSDKFGIKVNISNIIKCHQVDDDIPHPVRRPYHRAGYLR